MRAGPTSVDMVRRLANSGRNAASSSTSTPCSTTNMRLSSRAPTSASVQRRPKNALLITKTPNRDDFVPYSMTRLKSSPSLIVNSSYQAR